MRTLAFTLLICTLILCGACSRKDDASARERERMTPAKSVGKAAYEVSRETGKIAKKAGEELKQATHEAHQGWKEASQEQKAKNRK